jgi:hypothetical protein
LNNREEKLFRERIELQKREEKFRKRITYKFGSTGFFVQHIESTLTGSGVPDLYVVCPNSNFRWVELKSKNVNLFDKDGVLADEIEIRTGLSSAQRAWAANLHISSGKSEYVTALVECNDGILLVRMFGIMKTDKAHIPGIEQSVNIYRNDEELIRSLK